MTWASPRAWTTSETLTAAKMNEISSALNAVGDKPPSYSPTVFGSGWSSNHTISGTNQEVGKWTYFTVTVTFSGVPAGSGVVNITLPSTPSADYPSFSALGTCVARDSSAASTTGGSAIYSGGNNLSAVFGSTRLANAAPYTFANGDTVTFQGRYYRD